MKRGEIYFHEYVDNMHRQRRIPVLVVSENVYNGNAPYATVVRLSRYNNNPCPQHVFVPGDAFEQPSQITDSFILCETVSSTKQASLVGPVSFLPDGYHMNKVCDGLKYQMGMIPMEAMRKETEAPAYSAAYRPNGWYSAAHSPQMRPTEPMQTEANEGE